MQRIAASLAIPFLCASCVSFAYQREIIEREPEAALVEGLAAGHTDLGHVLDVLGAPIEVWEGADGAPVLTYGGLRAGRWNIDVSLPVVDNGSASFSYTDTRARTRGFVLIFGSDLRLDIVRAGNLADLRRRYERRSPASVDDEAIPNAPRPAQEKP